MQRHGWTLLFHDRVIEQLRGLQARSERAAQGTPQGREANANLGLFRPLSRLILEVVPRDPSRDAYLPDNMQGLMGGYWRRVEIGRRRWLFFRYDSKAKVIVFAWLHEEKIGHGSSLDERRALMAANQPNLQPSKNR